MFDITSSKLLILGIVALLVIGPKDLPALLRTIGKYMGIIKRHAADFRAQFDEAMRESELEQLKKEVEKVGSETEATIRAAELSVEQGAQRRAPGRRCGDGGRAQARRDSRSARRTMPTALPAHECGRRRRGAARPQRCRQAGTRLPAGRAGQPEPASAEPGGAGAKTGA